MQKTQNAHDVSDRSSAAETAIQVHDLPLDDIDDADDGSGAADDARLEVDLRYAFRPAHNQANWPNQIRPYGKQG